MANVFEVSTSELASALFDAVESMSWPDMEKLRNSLPEQSDEIPRIRDGCLAFLQDNKKALIKQLVNTFVNKEHIAETADAIVEKLRNDVTADKRLADIKRILDHLIEFGSDHDSWKVSIHAFQHVRAVMEMKEDDLYALYGDVLAEGEERDTAKA